MTPREFSRSSADLFKDRLKAARKQAGLTQDELGNEADISVVTLSKLETGVNRPTFEIFVALAHALNSSPNTLAGWPDQTNYPADVGRRQLLMRLAAVAEQLPDEWLSQLISLAEVAKKTS